MQRLQFFIPNFDRTIGFDVRFGEEQQDDKSNKPLPLGILTDRNSPEVLELFKPRIATQLKGLSLMSGYLTEEEFKEYYRPTLFEAKKKDSKTQGFLREIKQNCSDPSYTSFYGYSKDYHEMMIDLGMVCVPESIFTEIMLDNTDPFRYFEVRLSQFEKHANLLGLDINDLLSHKFYPNGSLFIVTPEIIEVIENIALSMIESIFNPKYLGGCIGNAEKWERVNIIVGDIRNLKELSNRNLIIGTFFQPNQEYKHDFATKII